MSRLESSTTSRAQIEDLEKLVANPLTERQVMVPLTTKAFFSGCIQPSIDEQGNEIVYVRGDKGEFEETTRQDAVKWLKRSKLENEKVRREGLEGTAPEIIHETSQTDEASVLPELPYFEIREEFDESGKEVRAEAINVMKELKFLESKEEVRGNVVRESSDGLQVDPIATDGTVKQKAISDEEYKTLSARLDELARLEEEDLTKRKVNQRSAKKLQGPGWGKGFLNTQPKKKKPHQSAPKSKISDKTPSEPDRQRQVVFREAKNEVKEIPRIGTVPTASLKKTLAPQTSRSGARPFEPEIFSGVVKERVVSAQKPMERNPAVSRFSRQRQQRKGREPRKLSKFARDRQEEI